MPSPERPKTVPSIRPTTFFPTIQTNLYPTAYSSKSTSRTTIRHRSSTPSKSTMPIRGPTKRSISSATPNERKTMKTAAKNGPSTS